MIFAMQLKTMHTLFVESFYLFFFQIPQFFSAIDPAYMDLVKIFAGSIGWIGSLTIFMWWKEKRKQATLSLAKINRSEI
jgi:hypothetical protein